MQSRQITAFSLVVSFAVASAGALAAGADVEPTSAPDTAKQSQSANATETPEQFLTRYFDTLHKSSSIIDLKHFYPRRKDDQQMIEEIKKNPELNELALEMIKGEPKKVKIVSKKEQTDKVVFALVPEMVPEQFSEQAKHPGFSMTGEVILQKNGQGWLVYKDYWTVKGSENGGTSTTRFGHNPESQDKDESKTGQ